MIRWTLKRKIKIPNLDPDNLLADSISAVGMIERGEGDIYKNFEKALKNLNKYVIYLREMLEVVTKIDDPS